MLIDHFSQYGTIKDAVIIVDRDNSKDLFNNLLEPRGFGFVTFNDVQSVQ